MPRTIAMTGTICIMFVMAKWTHLREDLPLGFPINSFTTFPSISALPRNERRGLGRQGEKNRRLE